MEVYLWGATANYQTKTTSKKRVKIPKRISFPVNVAAVCFSKSLIMILTRNGDVYQSQSALKIRRIPELQSVVRLKCGDHHFAAVTRTNQLYTWNTGSLYPGALNPSVGTKPRRSMNGQDIIDVFCGPSNTFVLNDNNEIFASGNNVFGQLGVGSVEDECQAAKVILPAMVISIASDITHTLFLTSQGDIFVSGRNKNGCLGLETLGQKINIPVKLPAKEQFKSISADGYSSAISDKGHIYVWGNCHLGLVTSPAVIDKINKRFVDVCISNSNGYARTQDGQLWVWGANSNGQLGVGDLDQRLKPFPVVLLQQRQITKVFAGMGKVLCVTQDRKESFGTFKRECCVEKGRNAQCRDKSLSVSRNRYKSPSCHRSSRSRQSRNSHKLSKKPRPIKCLIKIVDQYQERESELGRGQLQGTYSSIPNLDMESAISNKNQSPQKSNIDSYSKFEEMVHENQELKRIISEKDLLIEEYFITTKIQMLEQVIEERQDKEQFTIREHIVRQVKKMEARYVSQIGRLSTVIENFAVRYNTETTNAYDTLVQKECSHNKENVIMNITSKHKERLVINTQESDLCNIKRTEQNYLTITSNVASQLLEDKPTINHGSFQNRKSPQYQQKINELQQKMSSITQYFSCQIQNFQRQLDMYHHKVREMTKIISQKDQVIQTLKVESLNHTGVLQQVTDSESSNRRNLHIHNMINNIQKNRKKISLSADKLIHILEDS